MTFRQPLYAKTFGISFTVATLVAILGVVLVHAIETRVGYGAAVIVCGTLALRAFRSAEVIQTNDDVVIREILGTNTYRRKDVRRFSVTRRQVFGRDTSALAIELADGRKHRSRAIFGPDTGSGRHISGAVSELNRNWGLAG